MYALFLGERNLLPQCPSAPLSHHHFVCVASLLKVSWPKKFMALQVGQGVSELLT